MRKRCWPLSCWSIMHAGTALQQAWLPALVSGEALIVLAQQERGARYQLEAVNSQADAHAGPYRITGQKSLVAAGDLADAWIIPALLDGKTALFVVDKGAQGLKHNGYVTQDGSRAAELSLTQTPAQLLTLNGAEALQQAAYIGMAGVCAEGVGVMEQTLALTADYLNQRKQFGVVIASFQALRHRMADMKMQLELGRSMSYYAWLKLDEPEAVERKLALSRAKYQLGQSMRYVGQQSVQLHGGIGVTDEYIGSHYFKKLTQLEIAWGDSFHHLGIVSDNLQDAAGVAA